MSGERHPRHRLRARIARLPTVAVAAALVLPAGAAAAPGPPYTVKFDSTEVYTFLGQGGAASGTETSEYTATVELARGSGGAFSGSAQGAYAQASGTATASCSNNGTSGTTTETETSGNGATFGASVTPTSTGAVSTLTIQTGMPTENYNVTSDCGSPPPEAPQPRWWSAFTNNHSTQISFATPDTFVLPLTAGSGDTAGTYTFSNSSTSGNATITETTNITVTETPCLVPSVVNESQASATSSLQNAGCTVGAVTQKQSTAVAIGNVIASTPPAGTQLAPLAPVALVISSGSKVKRQCVVPKVKGDTQAVATKALHAANCALGKIKKSASSKVKKGLVISTSPAAGAAKATGTKVNLTISSGPKKAVTCKVPNVVGKSVASAVKAIMKANCAVGKITTQSTTSSNIGKVLGQSPSGGAVKPKGTKVELTVGS